MGVVIASITRPITINIGPARMARCGPLPVQPELRISETVQPAAINAVM